MIYPSDWFKMRRDLPEEFHTICNFGMSFEEFLLSMEKKGYEWISGNDIKEFEDLTLRITAEYLKIIESANLGEDAVKKVREDMRKVLTAFMSPKEGEMKDISKIVVDEARKGTLGYWFPTYVAPIVSFVHSRIYDSLIEAVQKVRKGILYNFVNSSTSKADIYPRIEIKETLITTEKEEKEAEESGEGEKK